MAYEVEQRARLDRKELDRIKNFLEKNSEFQGYKEMKSFLFRKPNYLRIRLIKGAKDAVITVKTGTYEDKAREEKEFKLPLKELNSFISEKKKEGFTKCAVINTKRFSYRFRGLNIDVNEIDFLGMTVEVEGITEDKDKIDEINIKIDEVFKILNLKKLEPKTYQKMMDEMYKTFARDINKQVFSFN